MTSVTQAVLESSIIRFVSCLVVFLIKSDNVFINVLRLVFLFFINDLLDGWYYHWRHSNIKEEIDHSLTYNYADKALDHIGYFLGITLMENLDYLNDIHGYLWLSWVLRLVGIVLMYITRIKDFLIIFPDLIKELIIVRLILGQMSIPLFLITFIVKAGYEYYHHRIRLN